MSPRSLPRATRAVRAKIGSIEPLYMRRVESALGLSCYVSAAECARKQQAMVRHGRRDLPDMQWVVASPSEIWNHQSCKSVVTTIAVVSIC